MTNLWLSKEAHRKGLSDIQWAGMQPKKQNYYLGDIIEFQVGGFGVIVEACAAHDGWPPEYSTKPVEGLPYRDDMKYAWHYEGDFKSLYAPSALRSINTSQN